MKKTTKRILAITSVVIVICISSVLVYGENQTDEAENYFYTAELYARGLGVEQNYEKASYWYHKAADNGNIKAISQLGGVLFVGRSCGTKCTKRHILFRESSFYEGRKINVYACNCLFKWLSIWNK